MLSAFRSRLIAGKAELLLFDTMLTLFREQGLLKAKGRQRTDSTHVLAAIQTLNRLACIGETIRHALNALAAAAPAWLQAWVPASWFDRYSQRFAEYRLPPEKPARYALAEQIGSDGRTFLEHSSAPDAPTWVRELPAVQVLRQVWVQQFHAGGADQPVRWRTAEDVPPAPQLISSPYDPDARSSKKRETEWTGDTVHLTETCADETPQLITDVTTTPAPTPDAAVLPTLQDQLARRDLTPSEHVVAAGDMRADHLLTSRTDYGIDLVGPMAADPSWQATAAAGFAAAQFVIDWEAQRATCPQGKTSVHWRTRAHRQGRPATQIRFATTDCAVCSVRSRCTQSANKPRVIQLHDRDHDAALHATRQRQQSELFKRQYARRAGIEGTIAQGTRIGDLRRSRSIGLAKTTLVHVLIAAALNFMRVAAWLVDTRRAETRHTAFAKLGGVPI